jgi:hypothetical protein
MFSDRGWRATDDLGDLAVRFTGGDPMEYLSLTHGYAAMFPAQFRLVDVYHFKQQRDGINWLRFDTTHKKRLVLDSSDQRFVT